jgi:nucleotidyltransferase substrate binding protein (TIGR01987 family)
MSEDIRWKQRFDNFLRALQTMRQAAELSSQRRLSELEKQGLVQGFEFTHELSWKVLKDYLEAQGVTGIIGSKNAVRSAFKNDLINEADAETLMDMIRARNLSSHTYNQDTAEEIVDAVLNRFHPVFEQLARTFSALAAKGNYKPGSDIDLSLHGAGLTLQELWAINDELDELLLPYSIDVLIFEQLTHEKLKEHIERVGVVFYQNAL